MTIYIHLYLIHLRLNRLMNFDISSLIIPFFTWIGSVCGHILSLYSEDFKGTTPFLKQLLPKRKKSFYFRCDFILLPIIGSILANVLLEPTNIKTALFSGLSWSGVLIALLRNSQNRIEKNTDKE